MTRQEFVTSVELNGCGMFNPHQIPFTILIALLDSPDHTCGIETINEAIEVEIVAAALAREISAADE